MQIPTEKYPNKVWGHSTLPGYTCIHFRVYGRQHWWFSCEL